MIEALSENNKSPTAGPDRPLIRASDNGIDPSPDLTKSGPYQTKWVKSSKSGQIRR